MGNQKVCNAKGVKPGISGYERPNRYQ